VPPEASQIAPVLAQAESASRIAPSIVVTKRAGQTFRAFASFVGI